MTDIYVDNDNLIVLDALSNTSATAPSDFVNDATVTAQLKTITGTPVGSEITLSYVSGSDGRYEGVLESSVSLTVNQSYLLVISVASGEDDGDVAVIEQIVRARLRRNLT